MKSLGKLEILFSLLLIVFFFMPWYNFGLMGSVSGYQIPDTVSQLNYFGSQLSSAFNSMQNYTEPQKTNSNHFLFIFNFIYILPILSLIVIFLGLTDRSVKTPAFFCGQVPILILIYAISIEGIGLFRNLLIGAWLTIIFSIGLILASMNYIEMPHKIKDQE